MRLAQEPVKLQFDNVDAGNSTPAKAVDPQLQPKHTARSALFEAADIRVKIRRFKDSVAAWCSFERFYTHYTAMLKRRIEAGAGNPRFQNDFGKKSAPKPSQPRLNTIAKQAAAKIDENGSLPYKPRQLSAMVPV